MMKILAIETNKGFYISQPDSIYYEGKSLSNFLFDGIKPQPSFHNEWSIIPEKPTKISRFIAQPDINQRFILKDDTLKSERLPLEVSMDKVGSMQKNCEDNMVFIWNDEWSMYRSLYQEISDPQPDKEVCEEFEFNIIFKIDKLEPPTKIEYPLNEHYDRWKDKLVTDNLTNNNVEHQILDKIIFPTILLHETPCKISSDQTYELVKNHIKRYIDSRYAVVTSDYDFCFEVSKIIPISNPHTIKIEHTPRWKRKPIVETRMITDRKVKVFEMTNEKHKYSGYTIIEGFEGKTEADLKEQIDNYLNELITFINEPLVDCPHCQGRGVLLSDKNKQVQTHKIIKDVEC